MLLHGPCFHPIIPVSFITSHTLVWAATKDSKEPVILRGGATKTEGGGDQVLPLKNGEIRIGLAMLKGEGEQQVLRQF